MEKENFITEKRVAELSGRSLSSLRADRKKKQGFPFFKIGKNVRYSEAEVMAFIQSCRQGQHFKSIQG